MAKKRLTTLASVIALCTAGAALAPTPAAAQDPILFVHGWSRTASDWDAMIERFEADGYAESDLRAYTYDTAKSNVYSSKEDVWPEVEALREETEAEAVDIVAHSMGGLNTRWFVRWYEEVLGEAAPVDDWVSLGGPNHGTKFANLCSTASCVEMRPESEFLNTLNSGDETPGKVNYGTWWSPCDEFILPQESTVLEGATNTETACISHGALLTNETVYNQVREFVK